MTVHLTSDKVNEGEKGNRLTPMVRLMSHHVKLPIEKSSLWRRLRHAIAVLIEPLRKPGRFSLYHYSREAAFKRIQEQVGTVLDLGCGTRRLSSHVIAVDLNPGELVDVVGDGNCLPFGEGTCEGVWMGGLLEHVENPGQILAESMRVLKPGGWLYCEVPFLWGEHNAPGDYRRWTRGGLRQLFREWDIEWLHDVSGPFSALAYQMRSCLSIITSFGSDLLYRVMFEAVWSYVVWPVKFLDPCFKGHPRAQADAAAFGIMVRKRS